MKYEKERKELYLMQQIYGTIFSLSNKIQTIGDKSFEGLTLRQFMTMLAILHLPEEEATLNRIAAKTGTTKQNINNMVAGLEKKGFVKVNPSKTDKRAVNVAVTQLGKERMGSGGKESIYFMAELFADFTVEELGTLWSLLKKMYRFDGQIHDGFEENVSEKITETDLEEQTRVLAEFKRLRAQGKEQ